MKTILKVFFLCAVFVYSFLAYSEAISVKKESSAGFKDSYEMILCTIGSIQEQKKTMFPLGKIEGFSCDSNVSVASSGCLYGDEKFCLLFDIKKHYPKYDANVNLFSYIPYEWLNVHGKMMNLFQYELISLFKCVKEAERVLDNPSKNKLSKNCSVNVRELESLTVLEFYSIGSPHTYFSITVPTQNE